MQRYSRLLLLAVLVAGSVCIPACVRGPGVEADGSVQGLGSKPETRYVAEKDIPQPLHVDPADGNAPDRASGTDVVLSAKKAAAPTTGVMREREVISTLLDKPVEGGAGRCRSRVASIECVIRIAHSAECDVLGCCSAFRRKRCSPKRYATSRRMDAISF